MVNQQSSQLDRVFAALADPTRRAILAQLVAGEATVGDLAQPFPVSLPAISRHLKVLEGAGLIDRRIAGRIHHCRLAPEGLREAGDLIAHYTAFWQGQLDRLAGHLTAAAGPAPGKRKHGRR
jgi:DNA-binding transcriptional ArsR family regulator